MKMTKAEAMEALTPVQPEVVPSPLYKYAAYVKGIDIAYSILYNCLNKGGMLMDTYLSNTAPLIEFYKNRGKLVSVDGINNTYDTIVSVIKNDQYKYSPL